jgi:hypothetical protein
VFTFLSTEPEIERCTWRSNEQGPTTDYSEFESSPFLSLSTRAGTPLGHITLLVAFVGWTFQSQNWVAKEAASAVVRIWCSLWVHAGCCEPAVRGLFALLGEFSRVTCTQFAPPERTLFQTNGFCGASGDATARGVNLYVDMVAAC